MRALLRLIVTLVVLALVGVAGYYMGYRAGSGHDPNWTAGRWLPGQTGTSGSGAVAEARDDARSIGRKISAAGSEASEFLSDAALTTKIKSKMGLDDTVEAGRVHVSTADAVVTLTGTVRSAHEHERAVQLARETKGVKNVVDRLVVER